MKRRTFLAEKSLAVVNFHPPCHGAANAFLPTAGQRARLAWFALGCRLAGAAPGQEAVDAGRTGSIFAV